MKKLLFTFITLFSLLVMTTSVVLAAPVTDGYLELREVRNDPNGSVIFVFDVIGEFSKVDFKGSFLTFGDNRFPLDCNLDGSVLQCTTSRATGGQYVTLNIGGFIFWTRVPERSIGDTSSSGEYCYPVMDLVEGSEGEEWEQFDTHCQDTPANYGDTLLYFTEAIFKLMPGSPVCSPSQSSDAFYRDLFCDF